MSLHAGQVKKLLRGQIIIAKVTLERAHTVAVVKMHVYYRKYAFFEISWNVNIKDI